MMLMSESSILAQITAYMAENRIMTALEAKTEENLALKGNPIESENLALKANSFEIDDVEQNGQKPNNKMVISDHTKLVEIPRENSKFQRLDCIYDDEPLGFEKDLQDSTKRMQAQDPLEENDL